MPQTGKIPGNLSHARGGIDTDVIGSNTKINVESQEYYLCKEAMQSTSRHTFKNKTNKQILDDIHAQYNCKPFDAKVNGGDWIVCKIAVADSTRRSYTGTVAEIVNSIQETGSCKVEGETADVVMKEGGEIESTKFDKAISASSRFRPYETIVFDKPIIGLNGNKLISYQWAYEWTMQHSSKSGELVSKRVSNWDQAESSAETGRDIVHKFTVEKKDGTIVTVSSETIPSLLGYVNEKQMKSFPSLVSAVKTLAKQKMKLAILEEQEKEYLSIKNEVNKKPKPNILLAEISDLPAIPQKLARTHEGFLDNVQYFKTEGETMVVYRQDYKSNTPDGTTKNQLYWEWESKEIEKLGGIKPTGLYDMRRSVERQEKKVNKIVDAEALKMESGGSIESDWIKLIEDALEYHTPVNAEEINSRYKKGHVLDNIPKNTERILVKSGLFQKEKEVWGKVDDNKIAYHDRPIEREKYWIKKIDNGERPPILLEYDSDESQLRVRDGNHRLNVYISKGIEKIPCVLTIKAKEFLINKNTTLDSDNDIRYEEGGKIKSNKPDNMEYSEGISEVQTPQFGLGGGVSNSVHDELNKAKSDLDRATKQQALMKDANAIIRSKKDVTNRLIALGISEGTAQKIQTPNFAGRVGFATYELTNNNANIKRLQDRVNQLEEKIKGAEKTAGGNQERYVFEGGNILVNYEIDRVQIFFDSIPTPEIRTILKGSGWNWSPTNGAWQRKITPQAIYNATKNMKATKFGPEQTTSDDVPEAKPEISLSEYSRMLESRNFTYVSVSFYDATPSGFTGDKWLKLVYFSLNRGDVEAGVKKYIAANLTGVNMDKVSVNQYPKTYVKDAKVLFSEGKFLPTDMPAHTVLAPMYKQLNNFNAMQKDVAVEEEILNYTKEAEAPFFTETGSDGYDSRVDKGKKEILSEDIAKLIEDKIPADWVGDEAREIAVRNEIYKEVVKQNPAFAFEENEQRNEFIVDNIFIKILNKEREKDYSFNYDAAKNYKRVIELDPALFQTKWGIKTMNVDKFYRLHMKFVNDDRVILDLTLNGRKLQTFAPTKSNIWNRVEDITYWLHNASNWIDDKPELVLFNLKTTNKEWTSKPKGFVNKSKETTETLEPNSPDEFDEAIMANIEPHDDWVGNLIKERDVKNQINKQLSGPEEDKKAEVERIFQLYAKKHSPNRQLHEMHNKNYAEIERLKTEIAKGEKLMRNPHFTGDVTSRINQWKQQLADLEGKEDETEFIAPDPVGNKLRSEEGLKGVTDKFTEVFGIEKPKTGGKIPAKFITLQIRDDRNEQQKYSDYDYAKANDRMRWILDNKKFSNLNYNIEFEDGETLGGVIDCEPREFFDGVKNPFTRHLNTFWGNVAKGKGAFMGPDEAQQAKDFIEKYDLGEGESAKLKTLKEYHEGVNDASEKAFIPNMPVKKGGYTDEEINDHKNKYSEKAILSIPILELINYLNKEDDRKKKAQMWNERRSLLLPGTGTTLWQLTRGLPYVETRTSGEEINVSFSGNDLLRAIAKKYKEFEIEFDQYIDLSRFDYDKLEDIKTDSEKWADELLHYKNILRNIDKHPDYSKKNVEQVISELENKIGQKPKSDYQKEVDRQIKAGEIEDASQGISLYHLSKNINEEKSPIVEIGDVTVLTDEQLARFLDMLKGPQGAKIDKSIKTALENEIKKRKEGKDEIGDVTILTDDQLTKYLDMLTIPDVARAIGNAAGAKIAIENEIKKRKEGKTTPTESFKGINHNYKNQYELNKNIEILLKEKGDQASNYTSDEKVFIRKYSGYGGLDKYGKTGKGGLFEYYTPREVIEKMWALAYKYGYNDGPILEPSVATGEFFQFAKPGIELVGYEISEYSAMICRILYPAANIKLQPFEQVFIKNNWTIKDNTSGLQKFDLVIGNPPYGDFSVVASRYMTGMGEKDHVQARNYVEYFIRRGIDLLNPGGLLIYIVGAQLKNGGTMFLDSGSTPVKEYLNDHCDFLDAYRLPDSIFERTGVTSEIICLRKK